MYIRDVISPIFLHNIVTHASVMIKPRFQITLCSSKRYRSTSQNRARRCDLWGRQCDQLLLSGDHIFTPGRQPGPQDKLLSSLGKRTLMIICYSSQN